MKPAWICAVAALVGTSLSAQEPAQPAAPAPKPAVEFSGLILVNGFFNSARVNNSDVPQFALADTNPVSGGGGALRQTRLRMSVAESDVLRGSGSAELDVDFFGGQPPAGGRTFPVLRLRRAIATVSWARTELLLGQEAPLVAGRDPRSLASIGFPDFAAAGNLWLWIPQARLSYETGYTLRLGVQGAVLAPTSNGSSGAFLTQPDSAERSGRPFLQGRIKLGWGRSDDPNEIAVGGHIGWIRGVDARPATAWSSRAPSPWTRASRSGRSRFSGKRSWARRSACWVAGGWVRPSGSTAYRCAPKAAGAS